MARASRAQRRLRSTRRHKFRKFRWFERLEPRTLLTATPDDGGLDWQALMSGHGSICQCPVCTGIGLDELPEEVDTSGDGALAESLASLPMLSSRPNAAAKLFLDFDGHFQASWGSWTNVTTPAYDRDGNPTSFSTSELNSIHEIWRRVAEDYAPFNIDVTTIAPGSLANRVVAHIAIGGSSYDWYGRSAGGVAYVGGFYNSAPNVGYAFDDNLGNGNPKYVAEAASHEAGHLFGLQHQSKWNGTTLVDSYNSGGNGWAPIMGVGYYQERTTWHNGPTNFGSTSYQDDLAILSGVNNAFGYVPDDFGNTRSGAAPLTVSAESIQVTGLIGRQDDVDVFSFTTMGGTASFQLAVNSVGPNLDAVLELWDANGTISTAAPTNSLGASLTASLGAGTYYVAARSMGDYGNMGQYTLTGTLPTTQTAPEITVLSGTTSLASGQTIDFGTTPQGTDVNRTITIRNDGSATLNLQPLDSQAMPAGFQLVSNLGTTALAPGGSTSFTIRLTGSTPGSFGGLLRIWSDDADENPFELRLAGTVRNPDTTAPTAQFASVVPNPRNSSVGRLNLSFSEPVTGVDLADLRLTLNDQPVYLAGILLSGSGASYTVDLANLTAAEGSYVLTLVASGSGIVDGAGNPLAANASVSWTTDTTRPTAQFAAVTPNPRNSAVGTVALSFTETVTGVNLADLRLTRNGVNVSLSGNLISGSGTGYSVDLANFTAAEGNYVLTLVAGNSGILDSAGNALAADASVAWNIDTSAPTAQFGQVAPNSRNQAVRAIDLNFSEAIGGLDLTDFQLTRDDESIALTGGLLTGSGASYSLDLSGLTASEGSYVLTLQSNGTGIADTAGNLLTAGAMVSWSTDTTAPIVQFDPVAPNPRNTAVGSLGLQFSESIVGFDLADLRLTRDGQSVGLTGNLLSGAGAQYSLDLSSLTSAAGSYVLTLVAGGSAIVDGAGNALAAGASVAWTTDSSAPTAQFASVVPNPRQTALSSLALTFSEAVTGLDLADFELFRNGVTVALSGNILAGSGLGYTLNLSDFTAIEGNYVLRLVASGSGITDTAGNLLASQAEVTWTTDTTQPTAQFAAISPDPRNTTVGALALTFSEPIVGLDLADLRLTRNGADVALAGNILAGSGTNYTLDLSALTASEGEYVLSLRAGNSGIVDAAGNAFEQDTIATWTTDTTRPTAQFAAVAPNPRNSSVASLELAFGEPVSGLDLSDIVLTRDGVIVPLAGDRLTGSGTNYAIALADVTALDGEYLLTLAASNSGIADAAGNAFAVDAVAAWTTETAPPTAELSAVSPNPRNTSVDSLSLTFSKPVSGVDLSDFSLTRDGQTIELSGDLLAGSGVSYSLDLGDFTSAGGNYVLTLSAGGSGIADSFGNLLAAGALAAWTTDTTAPTAGFSPVSPNPRNSAVGSILLTFSEVVTGFDLADLELFRNGERVPLAGNLLSGSGDSYAVDLANFTAPAGQYLLRLAAGTAAISDRAGNALASSAQVAWTVDTNGPTAQFAAVTPNPRNTAVGSLGLSFSEPIQGLDVGDFRLTRDGAPIELAGNLLSGSGEGYVLDLANFTSVDGNYVLTLAAMGSGIVDAVGNLLTGNATVAWTNETSAPLAKFGEVVPSLRNTAVPSISLTFNKPITGLDLTDFELRRSGQRVTLVGDLLAGVGSDYTLNLADFTAAPGDYALTLTASGSGITDSVGNLLDRDAIVRWSTDTSPPTAEWAAVSPNPRNSAVGLLSLTFSEAVTGLGLSDLQLLHNGEAIELVGNRLAGSGSQYTLDLSGLSAAGGSYVLTLAAQGAGVSDAAGNLLAADVQTSWLTDTAAPTAQFAAISPNPRNTAVGQLSLEFSEPVTGLDVADFKLTRDDQSILLAGSMLSGSGTSYVLDLSGHTAAQGTYVLTLAASGAGIVDSVGNPFAVDATVSWSTDTTSPRASFSAVAPNPRSTPVDQLALTFTEPITGLDVADLQLWRSGERVSITSDMLAGNGTDYTVDLASLTSQEGVYVLLLPAQGAGIFDAVGNSLADDARVSWRVETSRPTAQFGPVASPRNTSVEAIALAFSKVVSGLDLADLQLTRNGQVVQLAGNLLSGSGAGYTVNLSEFTALPGTYALTLVASGSGIVDGVGNSLSADASVAWTTELTPPTAQFASVDPSPRNSAVDTLALTFTEPVSGLDLGDLQLRRDGQVVDLAGNILSGSGADYVLSLENFTAAPGEYVLTLRSAGAGIVDAAGNALASDAVANWTVDTVAPWGTFAAVVPNPRSTAVASVGLTFSEAVSGLDLGDLRLTRNGQTVALAGNLLVGSGASYALDLANFTASAGQYVLTLGASNAGIRDAAGNLLDADVVVAWTTETTSPAAQFAPIVPDPRRTPVLSVDLTFTEEVTGVDLGDLELRRNGTPVSLSGNLLTGSGASYRLDLANFTAAEGDYVLTLAAGSSGIADLAGNALAADASVRWTTDLTAPTAQWAAVTPNPRNTAVGLLRLTFSEDVTGVDANDFRLVRDGQEISLASGLVAGSGTSYTLDLTSLTSAAGGYVLTLHAGGSGIQDGAGNPLAVDTDASWTTVTSAPSAEFAAIAPNPRNTAVGAVELAFSKPISGLDLADLVLARNEQPVSLDGALLTGSGASYTIDLANVTVAAGNYVLTLVASGSEIRDEAGNLLAADASARWSTDTAAPTATFSAVVPNLRNTAVGPIGLNFSEPIGGLDLADLQLTRGGVLVDLAGAVLNGSDAAYSLDLSSVTGESGAYVLTLRAAGSAIRDAAGNVLVADAVVAWSTDMNRPGVQFAPVTPNPRNSGVDQLGIVFTEAVTGFDLGDLQLLRNGEPVDLAGSLLRGSGTNFVLDLSTASAAEGTYTLMLAASGSGILDSAGNALASGASVNWTHDATAPTAQFAAVSPNPRKTAVGALELTFSESVSGFDLADLELTRNGQRVALSGQVLSGSGLRYTIDLTSFTTAGGHYVLKLAAPGAGIADLAGNALLTEASTAWTTDTTSPTAQLAAVTPDPRNTVVGSLGLTFSEPVTGLDLADLKLTRDGQVVPLSGNMLSGSGASYTLNLAGVTAGSGQYILTLSAAGSGIADTAGNALAAGASASWTTDASSPTAQFAAVTPSPRETPVGVLTLTISEPVTGVDLSDFQLTRNGAVVPLAGNILTGSGANYALDLTNFTAAEGVYVLTLVASGSGIRDSLGNPLAANASVGWTLKQNTDPQTPDTPTDVNGDGEVNTTDLLAVVNWIVQNRNRPGAEVPANLDTNGDGVVNVLDLLEVVNEIVRRNSRPVGTEPAASEPVVKPASTRDAPEGEATDEAIAETYGPAPNQDESLLTLLAADTASEHARRRRAR